MLYVVHIILRECKLIGLNKLYYYYYLRCVKTILNIACDLLLVSFMFVAATVLQQMDKGASMQSALYLHDKSKQFRRYQPKAALTSKNFQSKCSKRCFSILT